MGRIVEAERLSTADAIHGHWGEAEIINGGPISVELPDGTLVTRAQFLTKRNDYHQFQDDLLEFDDTQEPLLIAEREAIWGTEPDDENGVWFHLGLYKGMVKARLGTRHPLYKIVPNLGKVYPLTYASICHRFEDHWEQLLLVKPGAAIGGTYTRANLVTAHAAIEGKTTALTTLRDTTRPLTRAKMDRLYGDVIEKEREPDSLVAIMLAYINDIQGRFPGQPISQSLPGVFPGESGTPTPTPSLDFNYVSQPGGVLKLWFAVAGLPVGAALVFIKEGAVELTKPIQASPPNGIQVDLWDGVTLVDDLDEFEIRDVNGLTLASGTRNPALVEPISV